jgi:hypothetical protein
MSCVCGSKVKNIMTVTDHSASSPVVLYQVIMTYFSRDEKNLSLRQEYLNFALIGCQFEIW